MREHISSSYFYSYAPFGCGCSPTCVCMLCGIKAADCKYANCKDCDKITGHKGCQNTPEKKGGEKYD